jgi:methyl-accepting chemotaxis protein
MKIQTKLLGVIVLVFGVILVSLGIFTVFNGIQRTITTERSILNRLKEQLYRESSAISDVAYTSISTSIENYTEISTDTEYAFDAIDRITYLKKNAKIKASLEQINQMKAYMAKRRESLFLTANDFIKSGEQLGLNTMSMSLCDFKPLQYHTKKPLFIPYLEAADTFTGSLRVMGQSCATSIGIIEEQIGLIENESNIITRNAIILAVGIALLLVISVFLLSLVIIRSISHRIIHLSKVTKLFSDGDLGTPILLKGNDEISALGNFLEKMRVNLSGSIVKIQSASSLALQSKNELENAVEQSESETETLSLNIGGITTSSENLYSSVTISQSAVEEITKEVNNVSQMIESQASMVEESAASVTQMAASIASLSRIMEKNKEGSEDLVRTAAMGETQINSTAESIELIQTSASTIVDMAEIIQAIAEQTNILAMNAAIEAAHAGDSGKGFSVVADEIRHLAEAVSENSKSISESLKMVIENIEKANGEGKKTAASFQEIQKGIHLVSGSFDEILNGLLELSHGGNQIMEAMNELSTYTTDVNSNSSSIKRQTAVVSGAISSVNETANGFISASKKAQTEVEKIHAILASVQAHASTIESISTQLHDEASQYKVG